MRGVDAVLPGVYRALFSRLARELSLRGVFGYVFRGGELNFREDEAFFLESFFSLLALQTFEMQVAILQLQSLELRGLPAEPRDRASFSKLILSAELFLARYQSLEELVGRHELRKIGLD